MVAVCTGNVARSVMLGFMLTDIAESNGLDWSVRTAGTLVIEDSAIGARTRDALLQVGGLGEHRYGAHRSRQLTREDVEWADVLLATEANHVRFARTRFDNAETKAVSLGQFLREAPLDALFEEQLHFVSSLEPLDYFDVTDPAGKDQIAYNDCASTLWEMAQSFATLVAGEEL